MKLHSIGEDSYYDQKLIVLLDTLIGRKKPLVIFEKNSVVIRFRRIKKKEKLLSLLNNLRMLAFSKLQFV